MKKASIITLCMFLTILHVRAQKSEVFIGEGKAIKGYDPVAFFTQGKPVKGLDSYVIHWHGADWQFASKENLDKFKSDPAKYAPQYGGYCAYGTAQGHKAPIEIDTWTIVDGKLYFNYDGSIKNKWLKDEAAYIKDADKQWPSIKDKP